MKHILTLSLLTISMFSFSQNTMYFMDRLPQSIAFNPAIQPEMNFHMGLPGLSGVSFQAYNSGFTMNQLDEFASNLFNSNYNPDEFVNSIGDYNLFTNETNVDIFSLGFKLKDKGYLSFLATMNTLVSSKASSEIAYLIADLDDISPEDFPVVVDDLTLSGNVYMDFGVTYSHRIDDHLTLGITPRINLNMAGVKASNLYLKVERFEYPNQEDEYESTFRGDVELGLPVRINPNAIVNNELDNIENILADNWQDDVTFGNFLKNANLMIDLGAVYELEQWTFSASLLNLGNSSFKTNGYLLKGNNDKILVEEFDKVKIDIPAKLYIGAMRQFSPKWNCTLLFNNNFYSSGSVATATASLNGYVGKALSTSVSYTTGYKFNNLGLGLRLRFLPGTDLYLVTDNIIQAINYKNSYRLTAALGVNIAVGVKGTVPGPVEPGKDPE